MSTKTSSAKSIVFLPFDLNVSFPNEINPYIRIQSEFRESKRNVLRHILDDKNEQYQKFNKALNPDEKNNRSFKFATSIIDSSKYFDFIVSNFNYDNSKDETTDKQKEKGETKVKQKEKGGASFEDERLGFLDWYEKSISKPNTYRTDEGYEFEISKFGLIFNKQTRSGSIIIGIDWKGEGNKLELLSKTDFLRYHDKDRAKDIIQIELISFDRSNKQENQLNEFKIKTFPAAISANDKVTLKGIIETDKHYETKNINIGFCYSKDPDPIVSSDSVKCIEVEKSLNGVFKSIIDVENLEQGVTYYFRYYVVDENKVYSYGTTMTFIASKYYKETRINISSIVKENFGLIYELIFFNHAKPILLHLIKDDNLLEQEQKELSKSIYKTLRIPARYNNEKSFPINYDEIVNLKIPDARIIFGTMNEGVVIVDNGIRNLNEINKYLPAFVLALNQREFLLKVIRLVPNVNVNNQSELKAIKQFITEVYLKQLSFSVSIYNEIDLLFKELQMKFQIKLLMNDNKESINEIHQLIENFVTDEKNAEDQRKEKYLNSIILGLTIIQVVSIFYTLFNDYLGNNKYLFEIFLFINFAIIIYLLYLRIYQTKKTKK